MRTNLQDAYETSWDPGYAIKCMIDNSIDHGGTIGFILDIVDLQTLEDGSFGYGKWLKNW